MTLYTEWEGCTRKDADGDDCGPLVRVHFAAGPWVPYSAATWEQPEEGGFFEDIRFLRAEIDPHDNHLAPLTEAEIAQARAWIESDAGHEQAQRAAVREMEERAAP